MGFEPMSLVEQIHGSGRRCVLAVTGGGAQAIADLLAVPGGGQSVLEMVVPYSLAALTDWLGAVPDQACSEATARAMASSAWQRGQTLQSEDRDQAAREIVGLGATASLATDRAKAGPHRIHVATHTLTETVVRSVELSKGRRSRSEEQQIAAALVVFALADAVGVTLTDADGLSSLLRDDESIAVDRAQSRDEWQDLLLGKKARVHNVVGESPRVLFPGAFNPLHEGHRRMAEIAADRLGTAATFEISLRNVDKPPLDFVTLRDRLEGLSGERVAVTTAATFMDKARLFPRATFVVGADTAARIADPRYYQGSTHERDAAVEAICRQGCRFLVFGRVIDGRFQSGRDLGLPPQMELLCRHVGEDEFAVDVSSTALRGE